MTRYTHCTINNVVKKFSGARMNSVGLYKSCLEQPLHNFYMVMNEVESPKIEEIKDDPEFRIKFLDGYEHFYGVCTNARCTSRSLNNTIKPIFDTFSLPYDKRGIWIEDIPRLLKEDHRANFWFFSFAITLLVLLTVSVYCTFKVKKEKKKMAKKLQEENPDVELKEIAKEIKKFEKTNPWRHFDLNMNTRKILGTPIKNKISRTFMLAKALCIMLVISGHELAVRRPYFTNILEVPLAFFHYVRGSIGVGIAQMGFYSVSMFFFMGGFVAAISTPGFLKKASRAQRTSFVIFFYAILRRLARMVPSVVIIVMFYTKILRFLLNGPFYAFSAEGLKCNVGEILSDFNLIVAPDYCVPWLWYLKNDIQLYILLVLLFLCAKTQRRRLIWLWFFVGASILCTTSILIFVKIDKGLLTDDAYYFNAISRMKSYMLGAIFGLMVAGDRVGDAKAAGDGKKKEEVGAVEVEVVVVGKEGLTGRGGKGMSGVDEELMSVNNQTENQAMDQMSFEQRVEDLVEGDEGGDRQKYADLVPFPPLDQKKLKKLERSDEGEDLGVDRNLEDFSQTVHDSDGLKEGDDADHKNQEKEEDLRIGVGLKENQQFIDKRRDDHQKNGKVAEKSRDSIFESKTQKIPPPNHKENELENRHNSPLQSEQSPKNEPQQDQNPKEEPSSKQIFKKQEKPTNPKNFIYKDLFHLTASLLFILIIFFWFNAKFQKPKIAQRSPIIMELFFYAFSAPIMTLSVLCAIFKTLSISKALYKYLEGSTIVNSISNLSLQIYVIHPMVIMVMWQASLKPVQFTVLDSFCHFVFDFFVTYCVAWGMGLFVELPFGSLWRGYADQRFFTLRKKKAEVEEGKEEKENIKKDEEKKEAKKET